MSDLDFSVGVIISLYPLVVTSESAGGKLRFGLLPAAPLAIDTLDPPRLKDRGETLSPLLLPAWGDVPPLK